MTLNRRVKRLVKLAEKRGLTHVLVSRPDNVEYLTGLRTTTTPPKDYHLLLHVEDRWWELLASPLDYGEAAEVLGKGRARKVVKASLPETLAKLLEGRRGVIGLELGCLSYSVVEEVKRRLEGWEIKDFTGVVEDLRAVKDREELELIKEAVRIAQEAFKRGLEALDVGIEEREVAARIEEAVKRLGGDGVAFDTVVGSGPRAAYPHGGAGGRRIMEGDVVVIDLGARFKGYCSDLTRTVFVGRVNQRLREAREAVIEALERAEDRLKAGVKASSVDRAARSTLKARGLYRFFIHGLGHGVGLSVHEKPALSPRSHDRLAKGHVVTLEPGVYFEGLGGVRVEDMYVVGLKAERITTLERRIDL
ncbi:MAG: hypothetical protein DRJ97_04025 [Thermoprotei archaeon]|nr:MAG: hypothetical protein DRJ97_04025 [Thermoprotei archaeon]